MSKGVMGSEVWSEEDLLPSHVGDRWDSFGLVIDEEGTPRCVFCHHSASNCDLDSPRHPCVPVDREGPVWREAMERQEERWAWFQRHRPDLRE